MSLPEQYEAPRIRLVGTRLSAAVEMARWLLERRRIAYREEPQATVLNVLPSWRAGTDIELPLLVGPDGVSGGILAALDLIDRKSRDGERIYEGNEAERAATRRWFELFHRQLFQPGIQLFFHHALGSPKLLRRCATVDVPFWQKTFVYGLYPLWRRLLVRGLALQDFDAPAAKASIADAFTAVEKHLAAGNRFLGTEAPGTADIVFAALASPVIWPANYGANAPSVEELPTAMQDIVREFRSRPGGKHALEIYTNERGTAQPPLDASRDGPTCVERLLSPAMLRRLARLLVNRFPRLSFGKTLVLSRWSDVMEALDRDNEFLIEPINKRRIDDVNGPFILGMDRSPRLFEQRAKVYAALQNSDKQPFRETLAAESTRLLDAAVAAGGRIDVVNNYARPVACRSAVALLGIRGPTEQDLMRAARSLFHETFLNQADNPAVRNIGVAAAGQMRVWILQEIRSRRAQGTHGTDVLGELMDAGVDDDEARRIIGGLLVGAIDTTTTCVANIIAEVIENPRLKSDMRRDADDPQRFRGWCWEALRQRPHNAGLLREAGRHARVGGRSVAEGTRVLLVTLAAMNDPSAFDQPKILNPARPADLYLHFGRGLHCCAGRDVNAVQIPWLVRELVVRNVRGPTRLRTRGPFPDQLVVSIDEGVR